MCFDNSAFVMNSDGMLSDRSILYPPPSAQLIVKVLHSLRTDRIILLLKNSSLCIYKRVKHTCLLDKLMESHEILDSEFKRAITCDITCMDIVRTRFDG